MNTCGKIYKIKNDDRNMLSVVAFKEREVQKAESLPERKLAVPSWSDGRSKKDRPDTAVIRMSGH